MVDIVGGHVQPSIPPLPVDKNRPVQRAGSHNSKVMLDRFDVGMERAMRHRSAETT